MFQDFLYFFFFFSTNLKLNLCEWKIIYKIISKFGKLPFSDNFDHFLNFLAISSVTRMLEQLLRDPRRSATWAPIASARTTKSMPEKTTLSALAAHKHAQSSHFERSGHSKHARAATMSALAAQKWARAAVLGAPPTDRHTHVCTSGGPSRHKPFRSHDFLP